MDNLVALTLPTSPGSHKCWLHTLMPLPTEGLPENYFLEIFFGSTLPD